MGYVFAKLEVLLLFLKNLFNYFYWLLSNRQVVGSTPYGVIWIFPYEAAIQKQREGCADTAWGRYWLWSQLTGCQSPHQVEENYKIPKEQT